MIDKKCASEIHEHALKAISELSTALNLSQNRCSLEQYEQIKRGVGICIGDIQMELLENIYAEFPELNDLDIR